jgi:hypothetical protein
MVQGFVKHTLVGGRGALVAVLFLAWFSALGAAFGSARAADVFTVEDVAVDATAESAAAAREKAMTTAQQTALNRLFDRMVPRDQRASVSRPAAAEIGDLVRDFAVNGEKTSAVRYLANLSVRFRPDDIRALLRSAGVPFAETMSKPVVILPLLKSRTDLQLWEETNPWRQAWADLGRDGLVPFVVPVGDLDDVVAIDAERAQRGDRKALAAIAERYKAGTVIVATAEPREQDGRTSAVQITSARFTASGDDDRTEVSTVSAGGQAGDAIWQRAAASMAEGIEDAWKRANLIRFDNERSLVATVRLNALSDLVEIRKRLSGVSFLRSYEVVYLARDAAQFRLNFFGDEPQLAIALAQSDLTLEQDAADWILRRSGAPQRASAPDGSRPLR